MYVYAYIYIYVYKAGSSIAGGSHISRDERREQASVMSEKNQQLQNDNSQLAALVDEAKRLKNLADDILLVESKSRSRAIVPICEVDSVFVPPPKSEGLLSLLMGGVINRRKEIISAKSSRRAIQADNMPSTASRADREKTKSKLLLVVLWLLMYD